jgi:CRISPR/Cas system-associated endoribonuclease Cas2
MIDISAETEVKNIYRQRIAHILGAHELEVIDRSILASQLSKSVTRRTITINKLSQSLRKDRNEIIIQNTRRRHYLSFYTEIGPGAIPLLGVSGNQYL